MNATPLLKLIFDRKHVAIGDMEASVEPPHHLRLQAKVYCYRC